MISTLHLKLLAAAVWCSGGFVLLYKTFTMASQAMALTGQAAEVVFILIAGLVIGALKVRYLFNRFCTRNLARIDRLKDPKLWQCFRPGFLVFLLLMILFGQYMTAKAAGNYPLLLGMALLDLSLAVALLGSSLTFWNHPEFGLRTRQRR